MKIRNSLKSLKSRHRDCRVIRRRGRTYGHQQDEPPLQGETGLTSGGAWPIELGRAELFFKRKSSQNGPRAVAAQAQSAT